jgi:hypothetical protein
MAEVIRSMIAILGSVCTSTPAREAPIASGVTESDDFGDLVDERVEADRQPDPNEALIGISMPARPDARAVMAVDTGSVAMPAFSPSAISAAEGFTAAAPDSAGDRGTNQTDALQDLPGQVSDVPDAMKEPAVLADVSTAKPKFLWHSAPVEAVVTSGGDANVLAERDAISAIRSSVAALAVLPTANDSAAMVAGAPVVPSVEQMALPFMTSGQRGQTAAIKSGNPAKDLEIISQDLPGQDQPPRLGLYQLTTLNNLSPGVWSHPQRMPAILSGSSDPALTAVSETGEGTAMSGPRALAITGAPQSPWDPSLTGTASIDHADPSWNSPVEMAIVGLPSSPGARTGDAPMLLPGQNLPHQIAMPLLAAVSQTPGQPGRVEVILSPQELGPVRLEFRTDGDRLQVFLATERPETLDLMRRHGDALVAELRQAGYAGASLSFGQWGQTPRRAHPSAPTGSANPMIDVAAEPPMPSPPRRFEQTGGLDLRF